MERKTVAVVLVVLMFTLAGCLAGETRQGTDDVESSESEAELREKLDTFTQPAAGTEKVWSCVEWRDYNGHKMECELVDP